MQRLVFTLLVTLLLCLPVNAENWVHTIEVVKPSLAFVTNAMGGACTAFSIDQERGHYLTAWHCLTKGTDEGLFLDGRPARVLFQSAELDIAVLKSDLHRPGMVPRRGNMPQGTPLGALGYGYSLSRPIFMHGYLANDMKVEIHEKDLNGIFVVFSNTYIRGMSGGPAFDSRGRVVGIMQRADGMTGLGHSTDVLLKATGSYWGNQAWE